MEPRKIKQRSTEQGYKCTAQSCSLGPVAQIGNKAGGIRLCGTQRAR